MGSWNRSKAEDNSDKALLEMDILTRILLPKATQGQTCFKDWLPFLQYAWLARP